MGRTATNINRYLPEAAPVTSLADLSAHVDRQFKLISNMLDMLADGQIERTYVVPTKLSDGMIRYADGTSWNPGSGRGMYFYDSTSAAWKFLG